MSALGVPITTIWGVRSTRGESVLIGKAEGNGNGNRH